MWKHLIRIHLGTVQTCFRGKPRKMGSRQMKPISHIPVGQTANKRISGLMGKDSEPQEIAHYGQGLGTRGEEFLYPVP